MSPTIAIAPREWTRTHVVTPFIHSFSIVGAAMLAFFANLAQSEGDVGNGAPLWVAVVLVLGLILIALGLTTLAWRFNTYRIGDDALYHRKGVVFRQQRQARLDRLQAVDVVQPFVARIFGFAEATIEVAGGRASNISIKFLRLDEAEALRNEVLALAAGYRLGGPARANTELPAGGDAVLGGRAPNLPPPHGPVAAAPVREIYHVPGGRLVGSMFASWGAVIAAFVAIVAGILLANGVGGAVESEVIGTTNGGALGAIVWFLSMGGALWGYVNTNANFTAGIAADGIRLSHGLLDTRRQTVPPGRVQALLVKQSLLWRRYDWWRVTLNVAGYQEDEEGVSTLLPVGPRSDALRALWLVLPVLGDPDPAGTISQAMDGRGSEGGFTASPARSWIFDPIQWRHRGVRATETALLIRRGLLVREFYVIPHERTQSLAIRQGPLQRVLRLATVEIHSTRGPVTPVAAHLSIKDAWALIEEQAHRAHEGRAHQTPEQWMAAVSE